MFAAMKIEVVAKKKEGIAQSILQHPGLDGICLNVWVLQIAFFITLMVCLNVHV